jgi:modulator of FtsH protease HflK
MAWNEPGSGGSNGSDKGGAKDPWGKPSGGNKPNGNNSGGQPDLEQALQDLKNKFGALFGGKPRQRGNASGGSGSNNGEANSGFGVLIALILGLIVLWAAMDSFHIISAREKGVVLRFGKFDRTLSAGLNYTWPRPIESVTLVDVTQVRSTNEKVRMLTKDENLVDIDFAVQYTVDDPLQFAFGIDDPEKTLVQVSEAAIRQIVGSRTLDDVLVGSRGEIANDARKVMESILRDRYHAGILISSVNMQDASVPAEVKNSFDDAIRAREDEQKLVNEALAEKSKLVPGAEGRSARLLQDAEAYRDVLIATAKGEASRFDQVVAAYKLAPEVTRKRLYLETMEAIYAKTPKVLIDKQTGGGNSMIYLPLDQLLQQKTANEVLPQATSAANIEGQK